MKQTFNLFVFLRIRIRQLMAMTYFNSVFSSHFFLFKCWLKGTEDDEDEFDDDDDDDDVDDDVNDDMARKSKDLLIRYLLW